MKLFPLIIFRTVLLITTTFPIYQAIIQFKKIYIDSLPDSIRKELVSIKSLHKLMRNTSLRKKGMPMLWKVIKKNRGDIVINTLLLILLLTINILSFTILRVKH